MNSIYTNQYTETRSELFASGGMVGAAGGAIWFGQIEDGEIRIFTVQSSDGTVAVRPTAAGTGIDYAGKYTDADSGETALEILNNGDGSYTLEISVYRLAFLDDGVGRLTKNGLEFSATAPNGKELTGTITLTGDMATVTFTNSEWAAYSSVNEYRYYKA